jgi:hypothetical protein
MLLGQLMAAGFYLLLIDTVQLPELYAGLGVVALAWCAYEAARRQRLAEAWISPAWLMRAGRVLASLPLQSAIVAWEAVRQLFSPSPARGTLRAVSFAARGERPADVGRRALAEGLGSLAPNTIVIGVDRERELLLVHQLRRRGGREQVDVLGLG